MALVNQHTGIMDSARCALLATLVSLAIALLLIAMAPATAFATYKDVDTSHPAFQDLGSYGSEMTAAEIPDGVYEVEARTDSSMCVLYKNASDVIPKTNQFQAYIQVNNGVMTAVFYTSRMYTRLYFGGDGNAAAALTNADGTDDSAYMAGDPPDGYVPHLYTIIIPALNYPMEFASFAGGEYPISSDPTSGWYRRAKWYSHFVVFKPTTETMREIERAKAGGGSGSGSGSSETGQQGEAVDPQADGSDAQAKADGGAAAQASSASGSAATTSQAQSGSSAAAGSSDTAAAGSASGKKGVSVLSAAQFDLNGGADGSQSEVPRAEGMAVDQDVVPYIACGAALAFLVVVGVGWRFGAFNLAKTKVKKVKEGNEDVG